MSLADGVHFTLQLQRELNLPEDHYVFASGLNGRRPMILSLSSGAVFTLGEDNEDPVPCLPKSLMTESGIVPNGLLVWLEEYMNRLTSGYYAAGNVTVGKALCYPPNKSVILFPQHGPEWCVGLLFRSPAVAHRPPSPPTPPPPPAAPTW